MLLVSSPAYSSAIVPGFNTTSDGRSDDGTYTTGGCNNNSDGGTCDGTPVPIGFSLNYFGQSESTLFVNTNGNVSFDSPLSAFSPFGIANLPVSVIAPFFADLDTRNPASGVVTFGNGSFANRPALGVNWINVGYYDQNVDKTNNFQLLLVDRTDTGAGNFDLIFNYDQVRFETGDADFGMNGLGGNSADAGFTNGSGDPGTFVELPGSGVPGSFIDGGPDALVSHSLNSDVAGRYIFNLREGEIQPVPEPSAVLLTGIGAGVLLVFRRVRRR